MIDYITEQYFYNLIVLLLILGDNFYFVESILNFFLNKKTATLNISVGRTSDL